MARIEQHRAILHHIRNSLPDTLAEHCRDCAMASDQRLVLFTDGPAWAFQLRFHVPALLQKLSMLSESPFRSIDIRNLPAAEPANPRLVKAAASRESAQLMRDCARETSSSELAAAFARLADTLESHSDGK